MRLLLLSGLILVCAACGSPSGQRIPASEYSRTQDATSPIAPPGAAPVFPRAETATPATKTVPAGPTELSVELLNEKNGLDKRVIDLGRRREDLARNRAELEQKRARTALEHKSSEATEALDLERAEMESKNATQDLAHFLTDDLPDRLAEDALGVQNSWDGLLETREELAQLEMMYGDAKLGDATAEITLSRTKRRLQRAEEGHRLREKRTADLKSVTLPREEERLRLEVKAKTVALESSQRAQEKGRMARAEALRALEVEAFKLAREGEDIERDDQLLEAERSRWDKKSAEAQTTKRETGR